MAAQAQPSAIAIRTNPIPQYAIRYTLYAIPFMQNKANLCVFWAVNGDLQEKQTQSNPICSELVEPISRGAPMPLYGAL